MVKIIIWSAAGILLAAGVFFGLKMFGFIGGPQALPEPEEDIPQVSEESYNVDPEMRGLIEKKMEEEGLRFNYGIACLRSMKVPPEIGKRETEAYFEAYMAEVSKHCDNEDEAKLAAAVFQNEQKRAFGQFKSDDGQRCREMFEHLSETAHSLGMKNTIWDQALKNLR